MEEEHLSKKEKRELARQQKAEERAKNEKSKKMRSWIFGLVLLAALVFGGIKLWQWIQTPTGDFSAILTVSPSDHIKGGDNPQVTLFEYGDYQCPACAFFAPEVDRLIEEYGGKVRLVYRHFPLISIHKNAIPAARAAEAASLQGKFWEMHALLYEKQTDWENEGNPKDKFVSYAEGLSLDREKFITDYESSVTSDKVNADLTTANALGLTSTPTFFINGEKLKNPRNYDDFKKVIDEYLK